MVAESIKKVKEWCADNKSDLFIAGIIFFTGLSGFGLGRLSVDLEPNKPLTVIEPSDNPDISNAPQPATAGGFKAPDTRVFASRSGAVYYYSWCSGALRVKEENKVWFATNKEAEQTGLRRASGCK
ncbi:MAG: hypothetical protein Q8R30_03250 [bacterium]|nr:hypothetical protein [bacterium]